MLLSSLQGAAITSIKIENVLHEFSSLAGVREDVTDIVLNVKQIALKMEGEGPKRLQLAVTGPGEVKAGDIAVTGDIEVLNKDLVICHLDDGRDAQHGADRGHRQGLRRGGGQPSGGRADRADPGRQPVLAGQAGQLQGRERARRARSSTTTSCSLTIETDGTVTPEDAVAYAARILQDQLTLFVHFEDGVPQAVPTMIGMAALRARRERRQPAQPLPAQEGRRARAVGAFGATA